MGSSDASLNLVLMTDAQIRRLNLKYKKVNRPTDVLAFETGDIAISVDTASRNAKVYNTTKTKEILLYLIHGILHLSGYDDSTKKGSGLMQRKEDALLNKVWNSIT